MYMVGSEDLTLIAWVLSPEERQKVARFVKGVWPEQEGPLGRLDVSTLPSVSPHASLVLCGTFPSGSCNLHDIDCSQWQFTVAVHSGSMGRLHWHCQLA